MRLVRFDGGDGTARVGILTERGVVETAYDEMERLIDCWDEARPELEQLASEGKALEGARLLSPIARPRKILCAAANYWEHAQRAPRPLYMFLKSSDAVIGPGDTIELPDYSEPWMFMHEAELAVVLKGPARHVAEEDWRGAVFGYTCFVDVSARGEGRATWGDASWLGKSFDTFAPLGPCIATADEIADPNDLHVRFWDDGQLRHNYNTDDMEHRLPELVAWASARMTLNSGDVIACGTNHEGLGPLQDGETVKIEIDGIGAMELHVRDPLKRSWERGVYMAADSTNHDAVRRHHPDRAHLLADGR